MEYFSTFSGILLPAFLAGLIVLSTHIPLGREVLKRGIVFFDLAIAQVSALGLLLAESLGAHALGEGDSNWLAQGVAMTAAVAGASVLYLFREFSPRIQEALIGVAFMLASTGSLLLLASDPHGGERLQAILSGQILWVTPEKLVFAALVSALLLLLWFGHPPVRQGYLFYPIFAVAVTLSTQLVGVYLVFATLIVPALATLRSAKSLGVAFGLGALGYASGLLLSTLWDVPSGALITWVMAMVALVYHLVFNRGCAHKNDQHSH